MRTNLQLLRKREGFKSAVAFAELIGMNPNTYTAYEQGTRTMSLDQAWEFADYFLCSIDELAGRDALRDEDYSDPRRDHLLEAFATLDDASKDAAVAAIDGMAAACARGEARKPWTAAGETA